MVLCSTWYELSVVLFLVHHMLMTDSWLVWSALNKNLMWLNISSIRDVQEMPNCQSIIISLNLLLIHILNLIGCLMDIR